MIHTIDDVADALKILTGKHNPSIMDLDECLYKFYEYFLQPVLKNADKPLIFGFVNHETIGEDALVPGKDQVAKLSMLNHGRLPAYAWPGGLPIIYWATPTYIGDNAEPEAVCVRCAQKYISTEDENRLFDVVSWGVHTQRIPWFECTRCDETFSPLDPIF